jgi:hypothetical protein
VIVYEVLLGFLLDFRGFDSSSECQKERKEREKMKKYAIILTNNEQNYAYLTAFCRKTITKKWIVPREEYKFISLDENYECSEGELIISYEYISNFKKRRDIQTYPLEIAEKLLKKYYKKIAKDNQKASPGINSGMWFKKAFLVKETKLKNFK